jgi:hypothetical protein
LPAPGDDQGSDDHCQQGSESHRSRMISGHGPAAL